LLRQRSLLRERRILILVTANVPLVIIVYFFLISPYGRRITVNL
jgi:type II secretory pathway component PulM